jgi:hypothetical protein
MYRLNVARIMIDNPHLNKTRLHVWRTCQARTCDPWSFEQGYRKVVEVGDDNYSALYGFHAPTRRWHLWAN